VPCGHLPEHDVARLEGGDVIEEEEHFAPLGARPIGVSLDPEAIGDEGAEAAEGGEEGYLADLLTKVEIELRAMEEGVAMFFIELHLDGEADDAKEEEGGND